jgi:hypothetical protein
VFRLVVGACRRLGGSFGGVAAAATDQAGPGDVMLTRKEEGRRHIDRIAGPAAESRCHHESLSDHQTRRWAPAAAPRHPPAFRTDGTQPGQTS